LRVVVLMPVYNDPESLSATLEAIARSCTIHFRISVYLVDDGSEPPIKRAELPPDSDTFEITLARHLANLGQGAALETARRLALEHEPPDMFVTMDSDGQHDPRDLPALCSAIEGGADVAFGNRFAGASNVPFLRKLVLRLASTFEKALTGLQLEDAHNGFRAFGPRAMSLISMTQPRMAHATEIKQAVARVQPPLVIREVPVSIRYTADSLRRGQSSLGSIQILVDLAYQFLFKEMRR